MPSFQYSSTPILNVKEKEKKIEFCMCMPFAQWHNNKVFFSFWKKKKKKRQTLYIKY